MNFKKHFEAQSLIEILIGLGVVAVVFSSITGLMYVSLQNSKNSRERALAQTLIDDSSSAISGIINSDWHSLYISEGGVSYWPIDEGVGMAADNKIILDEIFGNNGLINLGSSGNTSLANAWQNDSFCISGKCLSFDGSDDQVIIDISTTSPLDLTNNFTISLWIYPTNNNTSRPIISKTDAGLNLGYKIENNSGILKSSIFSLGTNCVLSAGSLDLNQWQLITVVYNGSNISHYKNGELQGAPSACSISTFKNTEDFLIGARLSDSSKFAGKIDEIRIYQRVLTQDEIYNLFNYPASLTVSNIGGIWRIGEGIEKLDYAGIEFTRYFKVLAAFRDINGNLTSDNGNFDPLTKKIIYTVLWDDKKIEETQYISRTNNNLVFAQTDWSGGINPNQIVITAPNFFDEVSSSIIYTNPDLLTIGLGVPTSSKIDATYHWAWNDLISWVDFYGIYYNVSNNQLFGVASSSIGGISTNCLDLDTCATSNYQVKISSTTTVNYNEGDLYGYAWSPAIGWISFNCNQIGVGGTNNCSNSNYKVKVATSTGYFSGFAWNDTIGWISFNCSDLSICGTSDYKVKMNFESQYNEGYLISSIFDSGIEKGIVPLSIVWQGTLGTNNIVKFQIASSNSSNGPWNFIGKDGTSSSYYPLEGSSIPNISIPLNSKYHYNHRYFRYKIFLASTSEAPVITDLAILFNK